MSEPAGAGDPDVVGFAHEADAIGAAVVDEAADALGAALGDRVLAVYALGSLAHGGFRPLVSDVDVLVVLDDPVGADELAAVEAAVASVKGGGLPLAHRLSLFHTSPAALAGDASVPARLPPLDTVDLLDHGVLWRGRECREGAVRPAPLDLLRGAAEFTVDVLARPDRLAQIVDADATAAAGPRTASKVALFPVRFLYTARTGRIGENDAAAGHYLDHSAPSASAALVRAALGWRTAWPDAEVAHAADLLRAAPSLYREFVAEYAPALRTAGLPDLATALESWLSNL